jgi:hypothetical protein
MTTTLERISDLEREKTLLDEVKAARIERLMSELTDVTYKDFGRDALRRSPVREEITEADLDRIVRLRVSEAVKRERERSHKRIEQVKRIYFNAGRYSAGARDVNAQTAHAFVMSEGGD